MSHSLKSSSLLLLSHGLIKRGRCTHDDCRKAKKEGAKILIVTLVQHFAFASSSCAPTWPMALTILGRSIVHIILGFLIQDACTASLIGHHSCDRKLLESLQSKFQMTMTMMFLFMHSDRFEELLYVCYAAPNTNPSFWLAGGINRSFYKKSAGGFFNSGARVSLDLFRVGHSSPVTQPLTFTCNDF